MGAWRRTEAAGSAGDEESDQDASSSRAFAQGLIERHAELLDEYRKAVHCHDLRDLPSMLEDHIAGGLGVTFPAMPHPV